MKINNKITHRRCVIYKKNDEKKVDNVNYICYNFYDTLYGRTKRTSE